MKKILLSFVIVFMILSFPTVKVSAHPGNTDSNGCHTCRKDCAKWCLSTGQYHCHNGGSSSGGNVRTTTRATARTTTRKLVYGCIDASAFNYNSSANMPDGTCKYAKEIAEERTIKYETETKGSLKRGKLNVIKEGSNGTERVVIKQIVDENGNEVSSEIVSKTIISEPFNQVVEYQEIKATEAEVTKENTYGGQVFLIVIFLLIVNLLYSNKSKTTKLLINEIRKLDKGLRYIIYALYFIFIIPVFIDTIIIIINLFQKKK